jgi:uncharacterized membrane protein
MRMRKSEMAVLGLILLSFILAVFLYPYMPEQMASHWNARGEVDGYMSKFWGLFLVPFTLLGVGILFIVIPRIDPLKANIERFRRNYDGFMVIFFIIMLAFYAQVILWNSGIEISPNKIFPIGLGLLLFYVGVLCEKAKRNWFIGIRTPWTLSSEAVWDKTHKLAGKLFKIAGAVALIGVFFGRYAFLFILIPVVLISLYTVIYSYIEFQREIKEK